MNIRLTGAGGGPDWYANSTPNASVIDLRYSGTGGKIETLGRGTLTIDHLTIKDGGTANSTPLIHTTNTTLNVTDNTFVGSGTTTQDAIVLGGTVAAITSDTTGAFQGYGTVIDSNVFTKLNRGVYLRTWANSVTISNNSWIQDTGTTAAIESDGSAAPSNGNYGLTVTGNTIEMNSYIYGIKLSATRYSTFENNSFWDPTSQVINNYNLADLSTSNTFIAGVGSVASGQTYPDFGGDSVSMEDSTMIGYPNHTIDSSGKGEAGNEFAGGLVVKGSYTPSNVYPGGLTVSSLFTPGNHISIVYDDANNRGIIETKNNSLLESLTLNPSGGDVGIGTITPAATLFVQGTSSAPTVNPFAVASSNGNQLFTVLPDGNVGIGTSSPSALLTVGNNSQFTVTSSGAASSTALTVSGSAFFTGLAGQSCIGTSASGLLQAGSCIGGSGNSAWTIGNGLIYSATSTDSVLVGTSTPSNTQFLIQGSGSKTPFIIASSTGAQLLTVTQAGNIGIGTSSPGRLLTIGGNMQLTGSLFDSTNASGTVGALLQATASGTQWVATSTLGISSPWTTSGSNIYYMAGNVGVGTTTPGAAVDIFQNSGEASKIQFRLSGTGTKYFALGYDSPSNFAYMQSTESGVAFRNLALNPDGGNVGIGTTSPPQLLTVGSNSTGGNELISKGWLCVGNGAASGNGSCSGASAAGTIYANNLTVQQGDYAERYLSTDPGIATGTVVAIDQQNSGYISTATSTSGMLGVVSTAPGIVIGDDSTNNPAPGTTAYPIALTGRVPVHVTGENGAIAVGDFLTLSSQDPGYATKATSSGEVIGQALQSFDPSGSGSTGTVLGFINVAYQVIDLPASISPWQADFASASAALNTALQTISNQAVHIWNGAIYAVNGMFDKLFAKEVHTDLLCVGQTCVTQAQFLQMVQNSTPNTNASATSAPVPTPQPTDTPTKTSPDTTDVTVPTNASTTGDSVAPSPSPSPQQNISNPAPSFTPSPSPTPSSSENSTGAATSDDSTAPPSRVPLASPTPTPDSGGQ